MTPDIAECAGLWRRSLLIDADGSRDTSAGVRWLQGITAFVDSRGFAGWLSQRGDIFEWSRPFDLQPGGPYPDAGRMSWDGETLIEVGVHADYAEHWVRDAAPVPPCWALTLRGADGSRALLLRVGEQFGWARRTGEIPEVLLGAVGGTEWSALSPVLRGNELYVDDVRWSVKESEGSVEL
jgi:hypothetical protein